MRKPVFAAVVILLSAISAQAGEGAPLPEVGVVTLKADTVKIASNLNGRAVAFLVAEVRPQVNGIIKERLYTEGTNVKAGDLLYEIDPAMYEAQLLAAKADLAKAQSNLDAAAAKEARYRELVGSKAVSQQDYDDVNAAFKQAQAAIGIAEAQVRIAQINLDYTTVPAPISGRIGKSTVTQGSLVTANQPNPLVTIQQLDPIYVDVSQSTAGLLQLRNDLDRGILDNTGESHGTVAITLSDGKPYEHEGKVLFSDVTVEQSTGTVSLRALFPNPDWMLLPGMFVRANITHAEKKNAISVPQQALMRRADGSAYVYVVGADSAVEVRNVVTLQAINDTWLIGEGLKEDERVIVEGLLRVRVVPGMPAPKVKAVEVG